MPVKIIDTASPFLRMMVAENPKFVRNSVKSAGWWMQQDLKAGIKAGAPGGVPYPEFSGLPTHLNKESRNYKRAIKAGKSTEGINRYQQIRRNSKKTPLGKLGPAVRYKFYNDSIRAIIGWVTPSAEKLGMLQEEGGETQITGKMKRLFWAAGIPISIGKSAIKIPKHPTIDPEYKTMAPKVPAYVEQKLWGYIQKAESK